MRRRTVDIARLDMEFKGVEAGAVRAALAHLPAALGAALGHPAATSDAPLHVAARPDAAELAQALAQRIAAAASARRAGSEQER